MVLVRTVVKVFFNYGNGRLAIARTCCCARDEASRFKKYEAVATKISGR
jgi:hypothetical protein